MLARMLILKSATGPLRFSLIDQTHGPLVSDTSKHTVKPRSQSSTAGLHSFSAVVLEVLSSSAALTAWTRVPSCAPRPPAFWPPPRHRPSNPPSTPGGGSGSGREGHQGREDART